MAFLALALVLLPGLLVVRAPWTAIAPLSLACWTLAAWWPPLAGPGRSRILLASLGASLVLALLRLVPKHEVPPPPGWQPPPAPKAPGRPGRPAPRLACAPSLLVLVTALGLLLPLPLWQHAPGPRLAFQTTMARLLVWRDGIPASAEPLLPLAGIGAHAPALATLAADVSHLTGLDPAPALASLVVMAAGLLLVGLYALHASWAPPRAAATGALVGLALSPWPGFLSPWGEGEALLALGFLLPASSLLAAHRSRSSAAAAALLLAAGALAQPVLAAAAVVLTSAVVLARGEPARPARMRLSASVLLALVLAAPGLLPLARALSAREALAIAAAPRLHELPPLLLGLGLASLAPLAFVRAAARSTPAARAAVAGVSLMAAALLIVRVHGWFASGQLSGRTLAALSRAAKATGPLEAICAGDGERDFVPALAGRRAGEPGVWIPAVYADEWALRERRACDAHLEGPVLRP